MRSLFPRIFVSVWLAMTLVGAAFAVIYASTFPVERIKRRLHVMREAVLHAAQDARERAARGEDASAALASFRARTALVVFVWEGDRAYGPGSGSPPEAARALARRARREGRDVSVPVEGGTLLAIPLDGDAVVVGRLRGRTALARAVGVETLPWRLLVVFLVAGLVSFLLARYLTRPLRSLRRATQRVAEGDLSVRVMPELRSADAEIAALGGDFDRMAERVEELVTAQQRLLTDVSHELNSPLARLRVALELARQRAGADAAPALDRIEREAERLSVMIGEILTVSRLEHARPPREAVDLEALLDEIVRDADFEAQSQGRSVIIEASAPVVLLGDEELLRRAIENIVRNAVRFAPEGTVVRLRVEEEQRAVVVRVRDHGPGVPEEALRDIFVPLYRVERDRDRKTGGAGLGLAIAEHAVRLHGGTIEAVNADGGGLLVVVRLPVSLSD